MTDRFRVTKKHERIVMDEETLDLRVRTAPTGASREPTDEDLEMFRLCPSEQRDRLVELLGLTEVPEKRPSYAPGGYGQELERVVTELCMGFASEHRDQTASQVTAALVRQRQALSESLDSAQRDLSTTRGALDKELNAKTHLKDGFVSTLRYIKRHLTEDYEGPGFAPVDEREVLTHDLCQGLLELRAKAEQQSNLAFNSKRELEDCRGEWRKQERRFVERSEEQGKRIAELTAILDKPDERISVADYNALVSKVGELEVALAASTRRAGVQEDIVSKLSEVEAARDAAERKRDEYLEALQNAAPRDEPFMGIVEGVPMYGIVSCHGPLQWQPDGEIWWATYDEDTQTYEPHCVLGRFVGGDEECDLADVDELRERIASLESQLTEACRLRGVAEGQVEGLTIQRDGLEKRLGEAPDAIERVGAALEVQGTVDEVLRQVDRINRIKAHIDPRPACIRCSSRWVPREGEDATVSPCRECVLSARLAKCEAERTQCGMTPAELWSHACRLEKERDEARAYLRALADYDRGPHKPTQPVEAAAPSYARWCCPRCGRLRSGPPVHRIDCNEGHEWVAMNPVDAPVVDSPAEPTPSEAEAGPSKARTLPWRIYEHAPCVIVNKWGSSVARCDDSGDAAFIITRCNADPSAAIEAAKREVAERIRRALLIDGRDAGLTACNRILSPGGVEGGSNG